MKQADLEKKAARKLNEVLRAMVLKEDIFPLPIPIAKPKTTAPLSEWRDTVEVVRSQSRDALGYGYSIEWETIHSRRHGKNDFPAKLSFSSAKDFLKYVGAEEEARRVLENADRICGNEPGSRPWCAKHLSYLRKAPEVVSNAIKLVDYLKRNPVPGVYARQLPVQVPTKFLEQERPLLEALIFRFAPECIVQEEGSFEEKLGLMTKESLIEFRSLDLSVSSLPFGHGMASAREMSNKETYFREFNKVLVVENHVPFLTLPHLSRTLAIMGNGFAVHRLRGIQWLSNRQLYYWGDIDLSGFSILAKLRESYPSAKSVLMDLSTFQQFRSFHRDYSGGQTIPENQLITLSDNERQVVDLLLSNKGLQLEQEHIDQNFMMETLRSEFCRIF